MYKTTTIAIVIALLINAAGLKLYNDYVEDKFQGTRQSFYNVDSMLSEVKEDILELRNRSMESISSNELRNAYISIEDNKRFFEYEVKMSRKSIEEFIGNLNADMEQINTTINSVIQNDSTLKEQLQYVLQEIELLKITEEPVATPVPFPSVKLIPSNS